MKTIFITICFLILCAASVLAQPRGDEPGLIRKKVSEHLKIISQADDEITKNPKKAELYIKRANLYVELYRMLSSGYLSRFYYKKPPELSVPAVTEKAIADFSQAIKIAPRTELFAGRGEMYAVRWLNEFRYSNWYEAILNLESAEWRDLIGWRTPEKELIIFAKVLKNSDFINAKNDFEKVLKLNADVNLSNKSHQNLATLFLERSTHIFYNLELNKNLIVEPNSFGYLILDEIDRAIEHIRKSGSLNRNKQPPDYNYYADYHYNRIYLENWMLRDALYYKAMIAEFYGKDTLALEALNEAEKYFDKKEPRSKFVCEFYPLRSRIYVKLGNLDAAFADADVEYPNPNFASQICFTAYEPRGDVYFARGDYLTAVADYTKQISQPSGIADVPGLYKKRGLAYIKLGEAKKAVADFTYLISYGKALSENYLLRAQAHRIVGDENLALDDEKNARQVSESKSYITIKRGIYGKIIMPSGQPVNSEKISIGLSYVANPAKKQTTSVDEQGRFLFTNIPEGDFRIFAYFDGTKDGVAVRFYGLSDKMNIENKLVGPIILKLDRTVTLAKQPANSKS